MAEPKWITYARAMIGQREIKGPKHNSWIVGIYVRLKLAWLTTDEVPWCGAFVADCISKAGLPLPKAWYRAASWGSYGVPVKAQVGAIGVKARVGGNHVFFIVGETADKQYYKCLGGNQSDSVNITDIAKVHVTQIRWPYGVALANTPLPVMARGTVSTREA